MWLPGPSPAPDAPQRACPMATAVKLAAVGSTGSDVNVTTPCLERIAAASLGVAGIVPRPSLARS